MNNTTTISVILDFQSTTLRPTTDIMAMAKIVYPFGVEEKGDFVSGQLHGDIRRVAACCCSSTVMLMVNKSVA